MTQETANNLMGVGTAVGIIAIFGGIIYAFHKEDKQKQLNAHEESMRRDEQRHEEAMAEQKNFADMTPEQRKEVMIDREKTKQAQIELRKAEAEKEKAEEEAKKAKQLADLINNPLPKPEPISMSTPNGGSINIKL